MEFDVKQRIEALEKSVTELEKTTKDLSRLLAESAVSQLMIVEMMTQIAEGLLKPRMTKPKPVAS